MDPAAANTPEGKDSFYWGGAFGTWFWLDPANDVVVVGHDPERQRQLADRRLASGATAVTTAGVSGAGGSQEVARSRRWVYHWGASTDAHDSPSHSVAPDLRALLVLCSDRHSFHP